MECTNCFVEAFFWLITIGLAACLGFAFLILLPFVIAVIVGTVALIAEEVNKHLIGTSLVLLFSGFVLCFLDKGGVLGLLLILASFFLLGIWIFSSKTQQNKTPEC